jgi:predicted dithiol-disulfide oxidoreductase (DUF899 family)
MTHTIATPTDWENARKALLAKEKDLTRARDALSQARRALPWERVEKHYVFDGPDGEESLADLFAGRSQLVVYHFMFAPEWEDGCKSCSFWADSLERNVFHLAHRDATLVAISRAPYPKLRAFQQRFGWTFKWLSSGRSEFNYDYRVSFRPERGAQIYNFAPKHSTTTDLPGISVFARDADGSVFRTYSAYGRGIEPANAAYGLLDLLPKGRDEQLERGQNPMTWVRLRDAP